MRRTKRGLILIVALSVTLAAAGATAAASGTTGNSGPTGSSGPTGASGATGATSKPKVVSCPVQIASAVAGPDQWIWSAFGKPSSSSSKVSYSQTGGNGSWNNGQAKGTICSQDQGGGQPKRSIVLNVSGASKLTPMTKQLGLLGVSIVFPVTVSKSGDPAVCPIGATGTVSLFASYFSIHDDKASMQFTGTCAAWDETFTGSILHVKISHFGAEIR
jgi:hypothetical protein